MNFSVPMTLQVARRDVADIVTGKAASPVPTYRIAKRLRAVWFDGQSEYDLGTPVGFSGRTSFSGTSGTLVIAWPDEKNPRVTGQWWHKLAPDDSARVTIYLVVQTKTGAVDVPLLNCVPSPGGVDESYGGRKETVEIKLEDVTGVAARTTNYAIPAVGTEKADPLVVASAVLPVPYVCLYPTVDVDGCIKKYPNALAAVDDMLITQQDRQNPLSGQKRIRYGDRDGRIVYRLVEDPDAGQAFKPGFPFGGYAFEYGEKNVGAGIRIRPDYFTMSLPRINPYLELAVRLKMFFPRAMVDETLEIHQLSWRLSPGDERLDLKCRRQQTL